MPMIEALRLMAWLSPTYPIGAYAYSHGLEWAVETGSVSDEATLTDWLGDVLECGSARNDLILAAHAHCAAAASDGPALVAINDLALALAPSRELHLETSQQGRSFLDATRVAWPVPALASLSEMLDGEVAYPVAVGVSAGAHGMALVPMLSGFGLAFVQNLVSAALRVAPIGQSVGTRVIAALAPRVTALAETVPALGLDEIGSATLKLDLGSARHETQYSRIFRS
ncbi:urease accessory UreF family protein [Methylobacterium sp.]|uniref:urease accessory protein UreF n=1 Tax=Methylobacterium sp. TaxID=409 RepID=UPI0025FD3766|nr:urease accessory UreF family protein [Methylobacterium sp.]